MSAEEKNAGKREAQPMGLIGLAAWVAFLLTVLGIVYIVWGG